MWPKVTQSSPKVTNKQNLQKIGNFNKNVKTSNPSKIPKHYDQQSILLIFSTTIRKIPNTMVLAQ